jgi:alkylation response protein AidB-like acyl-CoA dehydrogenase
VPRRSGSPKARVDYALGYVQHREQFGKPIAEFQGLQFMLADMAMRVEAARGLVYRACALVDAGDPSGELGQDRGDGEVLRGSDTAMSGDRRCRPAARRLRLHQGLPVERYMRDAKITQIYEGTNQIQRVVIAKKLLG